MNKLKIENLKVKVEDKIILNNFNIEIKSGEIHVIMGPNGVGKSTLSKVIMGHPDYQVLEGSIYYNDILLNELTTDNYFSSKALEKGISLYYYTSMCKNLLNYKNAYNQNKFEYLRSPDSFHQKQWDDDKEKYGKYHDIRLINKVMEFLKVHYLIVDGIPNHYERYEKKMYDASELNTPKRYQGE